MKLPLIPLFVFAGLMTSSSSILASAEGAGTSWYGGIGAGGSVFLAQKQTSPVTRDDALDKGWRAYSGYRFSPYLALESGYLRFGRYEQTLRVANTSLVQDANASAWYGAVALTMPLGEKLALNGRVGTARTKVSGVVATSNADALGGQKTSIYVGVGAEYWLGEHVALTVDYDFLRASPRLAAGLVSVGMKLGF